MAILISNIFRTICILFIYQKLLLLKKHTKNFLILIFLSMSLYTGCCIYIQLSFPYFFSFIGIILFYLFTHFLYKIKWKLSFVVSTISFAIFYAISNISSFITALLCSPIYYANSSLPHTIIVLVSGILTCAILFSIFNIRRLKSGMSFLTNNNFVNISTVLCLLIVLIKFLDILNLRSSSTDSLLPLATILLALLLFTWWQKQITKSYIEKLRKLEVQSLYDELEEKERQIKKLIADNESLSRIIHKDNKLIPAMENAVLNYLSADNFHNPDKMKQYGLELSEKLQDMTRDRQGILDSYDHESHQLRLTGHVSLDAILVYMQKKADANHILLECKHTPDTIDYLLSKISEDDLTHLLSDLMENAIISMKGQENGRLQITFGKLQKEAYISIADSGINFDISTLHSFGLQPHTTHKDSGGSGIGLMDIWKIKRKYRATIQIQEYEKNTSNFTKRILFSFNAKNHYVIQSFRHTEISNTQTRGDLYVIPAETKEKNEGKKHEQNNENLNS